MSHVANQRIKKGGEYFAPGDKITLTEGDLKDLPEGAVTTSDLAENLAGGAVDLANALKATQTKPERLSDAQWEKLREYVASLNEGDFKKDGFIRKDSLAVLDELLDFDVTVEDVATAKSAGGE